MGEPKAEPEAPHQLCLVVDLSSSPLLLPPFFSPGLPAGRGPWLGVAGCGVRGPGAGSHSTPLRASPGSSLRLARFPRLPLPLVLVPQAAAAMPGDHGSKVDISFAGRFTASAIAACFAEVCTHLPPVSHLPRCWIAIAPKSDLLPSISFPLPPPRPSRFQGGSQRPDHPIPFNVLHLLARRYAPSRSTPPRSGSSCRRTSSPLPRGTPRQRSPSIAACSEPPPPSLGRKGPQRYGRASSRASIDSAFTAASALASTSLYCPHLPNQLVVSILSLID